MSVLYIRTDSFDMTFILTMPISSARMPVRFKSIFVLALRDAWRNVADFLVSTPVDTSFLTRPSDEIVQIYES